MHLILTWLLVVKLAVASRSKGRTAAQSLDSANESQKEAESGTLESVAAAKHDMLSSMDENSAAGCANWCYGKVYNRRRRAGLPWQNVCTWHGCEGCPKCSGNATTAPTPPAGNSPSPSPSASGSVKVMSYNLKWWDVFRKRNGGSVGSVIKSGNNPALDFLGFQECEDIGRVLKLAGLSSTLTGLPGTHAKCIAYNKNLYSKIASGTNSISEDGCPGSGSRRRRGTTNCWGTRSVDWIRAKRTTSQQTVLFMNFHGPLPVENYLKGSQGAKAADKLWSVIQSTRKTGDIVILVGDFNADRNSELKRILSGKLKHVFEGSSFNGVDHIFSTCAGHGKSLSSGGSDHKAVIATITCS